MNRIAMAIDAGAVLSGTFAFWATSPPADRPFTFPQAGAIATVLVMTHLVTMRWTRSYRVERYANVHRSPTDVCRALLLGGVPAGIVLAAFVPDLATHAQWPSGWASALLLSLFLGPWLTGLLMKRVHDRALLRRRVIVMGPGAEADDLVVRIQLPSIATDFDLLGITDPTTNTLRPNYSSVPESCQVDPTQYSNPPKD